jgi:hypothetical protein
VQTDFIALYRGQTVAEARLIALSADPEIVGRFMHELVSHDADRDESEQQAQLRPIPGGEVTDE